MSHHPGRFQRIHQAWLLLPLFLGGGFYQIALLPKRDYDKTQHVLMVTATSGRGSGVAVAELQMPLTLINTICKTADDL